MEKDSTLPAKLEEQVKISGIKSSEAQLIASNYAPLMIQAQGLADQLIGLDQTKEEDVETAKSVRIALSKICGETGRQKDSDKEIVKIKDKYIMALHNTVVGFARLTQEDAKKIEEHAERLEAVRLSKLKEKRIKELLKFEVDGSDLNVENMDDQVWDSFITGCESKYNTRKEEERIAEENRIKAEAKTKAYNERKSTLLPLTDFCDVNLLTEETTEEEFNELLGNAEASKVETARVISLNTERQQLLAPYWDMLTSEQQTANHGLIKDDAFNGLSEHLKEETDKAEKKAAEIEANRKLYLERRDLIAPFYGFLLANQNDNYHELTEEEFNEILDDAKRKSGEAEAKAKSDAAAKAKSEQEAKDLKAKNDKLEAEAKAKSDAEAKAKQEAEAKAKSDAAKPAQEKILKAINELSLPELDLGTQKSNDLYKDVLEKFQGFKGWAEEQVNNLSK